MFGFSGIQVALAIAGAAAIAAGGATAWHNLPIIGPAAVQTRLEGDLVASRRETVGANLVAASWRAASDGWKGQFHLAEGLRVEEAGRAQGAVNADRLACDARVAAARRATSVIREIVTQEVPRDASNCPVRGLVTSDRLRDIIRPGGPAGGDTGPAGAAQPGPARLR